MNYLVVGLGNIGSEYADTRHNMGFMVLDAWSQASNAVFTTQRYGDVAEVSFKGRHITLLKPSTYMNLSGNAVRYWMEKKNIPLENLLVICDDLNLPFGTLRMRKRGSDGGHNGLKHIQAVLGTQDWCRIRMGIGNEFAQGGQVDFVLGPLTEDQRARMPELCDKVIAGVRSFVTIGPDRTMNTLNQTRVAGGSEIAKKPENQA
ncbi:MAG: aminoacyl-tRNA hydrolase [Bacteroidales bacterium]|nr:aminoacyl-tRNA hydrolase [Bacteroidales bacterium]